MSNNKITLNGNTFEISQANWLSGLPVVFMARTMQQWQGDRIGYSDLSKDEAQKVLQAGQDAISGILDGIMSVTEVMTHAIKSGDLEQHRLTNVSWLLSGLSELAIEVKAECDNLTLYANS